MKKPDTQKTWPVAVAGIIVVVALVLRLYQFYFPAPPPTVSVTVGRTTFAAEIADTNAKKAQGLSGRDSLPPLAAMYFPFSAAERWVFWMKDMRFPIDIIWIRDGKVVDVSTDAPVPRGGLIERFAPIEPADAVLEVNAGAVKAHGIKAGDPVTLRWPGQAAAVDSATGP